VGARVLTAAPAGAILDAQLPAERENRRFFFSKVGAARLFGYKDTIHAT